MASLWKFAVVGAVALACAKDAAGLAVRSGLPLFLHLDGQSEPVAVELDPGAGATVGHLRAAAQARFGLARPPRLFFAGAELTDDAQLLADAGI